MKLLGHIAIGAVVPVLIIVLYGVATSINPSPYFPPITKIIERFNELWIFDRVTTDILPSLQNLFVGFALAVVVGLLLGVLLGRIEWMQESFLPLVNLARSIPPLMLIPPMVLVLGIGDESKVALIAFGALFPVCIATIDGMRQTDPSLLDMSRSIRLGPLSTLFRVYLPAASPSIFGGIQVALQVSLVLMVSTEMVAAYRGLGFITMQAQLTFDALTMWAGIVLLALIGFLANYLFSLVRRRALRWHIGLKSVSSAR